MKTIQLSIPTLAIAKARAKRNTHGFAYIPKKTQSFEAELRWHWTQSKHKTLPKCPTAVTVTCFLPMPKSLAKKKIKPMFPITKPDLDNLAKAILDGLNGFAWPDDNQIWHLLITKRYTLESPSIDLLIQWDEPVVSVSKLKEEK